MVRAVAAHGEPNRSTSVLLQHGTLPTRQSACRQLPGGFITWGLYLLAHYGEGLTVDWTEFEYDKIAQFRELHRLRAIKAKDKRKRIHTQAILRLADSGMSAEQIAKALRVSKRQVLATDGLQYVPQFHGKTYVAHNFFMDDYQGRGKRRSDLAQIVRRFLKGGRLVHADS